MRPKQPLLDFNDAQLEQLLGDGMLMDVKDPVLAELRDLLLELALRVREVRRFCKLQTTVYNGTEWVSARALLSLIDGR